jgi:tetratricopeptide (TPR) repeat protein
MIRAKFCLVLILFTLPSAIAQVRVWQGTLTLPTYEEALPDPNPQFDQYASGRFNYPYTLRNNLTNRRTDHVWRALFLENEYLKCSVLPDLGGHVYTCIDKISGKPMFYENPSIKKANIGYRGAWAAFGIEFNFPVSHNWVSLSPVDFAYRQNDDGSASIVVGNIDRVYGMQWTVELVLRPASTVLEQRVTLNNRSDVRHRFYWWNNAGVEVWDDSHIEYPMRFAASHGFREVQPWPVEADGTDLSVIHNQTKGPVSLFVHGSREPFMGVWNPHTDTGTVHYADYAQLPAKKVWSWGVDADGLDWRKALSDNNSAYVEVQAGLFRNQETYAFLEPRETISFSEFWMPVRAIGGISRANLAAAVNLSRKGNAVVVGLNVNEATSGATLRILLGNQTVFETKSDLIPQRTWSHEIPNADAQRKYTFELLDGNSAVLLRHTEGAYDWTPLDEIHVGPQPSYRIPDPASRTEDDWVQLGNQLELDGDLLHAFETYEQARKKFPESFQLQKFAGRLAASLLRFREAKDFLEPVHARETTDAEVSYYLGISLEGLGQVRDAREAYESAARSPRFSAAAGLRLAELSAREKKLTQAQSYLDDSRRSAPYDLRSTEELIAVLRAEGKAQESEKLAQQSLMRAPQDYFLLEQLGKPNLQHLADDAERVLSIAAQYMRLGLYSRALEALSRDYPSPVADQAEPGALPPQKHPMVAYFRGYCREKLGESGASDFDRAEKLSIAYVFPRRVEDAEVLEAALRRNPQDATALYLLGTLYFSRGLTEDAINDWKRAHKLDPQLPDLDASLGRALLQVKDDPEQALKIFQDGLRFDSVNAEVYIGIDQALSILGRPSQERVDALKRYPDRANMPSPLVYELILNLAEASAYDEAFALFHNRFFERKEGGTNVRQVWIELQVQHALFLAQHRACTEAVSVADHVSEPVHDLAFTRDGLEPFLRPARTNYLLGDVYHTCNLAEKADARFQNAARQTDLADGVWAWKASQALPGFQPEMRKLRLEDLIQRAKNVSESNSRNGWWFYNLAMLDRAAGRSEQAQAEFHQALLSPDEALSYHLTRLALADKNP